MSHLPIPTRSPVLLLATLCLALACDARTTAPGDAGGDDDPSVESFGDPGLAAGVDPRIAEAEALIDGGKPAEALEKIDGVIAGTKADGANASEVANLHFVRGNALSHLDRDEDAMASYRTAVELDPRHHRAHAAVGNLLAYGPSANLDAAVESLQTALELEPGFAPAHHSLGAVLYDLGRIPEAIEALENAHRLDPQNETKFILAQAHAKNGNIGPALRHAAAAVEAEPGATGVDLRILHARLLLTSGDAEAAVAEFQRAGDLAPDAPALQIQVVRGLMKAGRVDLAASRVAPLVEKMPDEPAVRINYGDVLARQGRVEGKGGALSQYDAVIALDDPELHAAHTHKIEVLARAGRCKAAHKAFKAFEKSKPQPEILERGRRGLSTCDK